MPVLRSRERASRNTKPEMITEPVKNDPYNLPESTRIGHASAHKRKNPLADHRLPELGAETMRREVDKDKGILSLRPGKKIAKPRIEKDIDAFNLGVNEDVDKATEVLNVKIKKEEMFDSISYLDNCSLELDQDLTSDEGGSVRKNKRKLSWDKKVKVELNEVEDVIELKQGQRGEDIGTGVKTMGSLKEGNGTKIVVGEELLLDSSTCPYTAPLLDNLGVQISRNEPMATDNHDMNGRRALSREGKGKDKVVEDGLLSNVVDPLDLNLSLGVGNEFNVEEFFSSPNLAGDASSDVMVNNIIPVLEDATDDLTNARGRVKERFRDIARKNASRFAHFSSQEREEIQVDNQPVVKMPRVEAGKEEEDGPGPFSAAMKMIRDRESNVPVAQQSCGSNKSRTGSIKWIPNKEKLPPCSIPKLKDICIDILVKNADAISSLESVPDEIRHKLCYMLCDSRKMNAQFLDHLVCGSPTEIRLRDCSWLTEEEFTRAFQRCDASHLTVLQLDQCGRCLPDYLLSDTLARSPNAFPVLTAMSIKGACRLSDTGLSALLASAPALRSINLGQCSLLTGEGINTLANSLGSILRELYMDDCQGIDPMLILPALLKLEQLEVLSVAGVETVSDVFVSKLVAVRGQNFKKLVLTDCMKLTDSSLKIISETCTGLHALELSNLYRLTDSTLEYLANGCRTIGSLKLSRNAFSDKAIAAYLEASGESLTELSLNNIRKVGDDTAISLAKRSKKLLTLDLSWCRNLTNESLGLIVDSCLSLKVLKVFGCTQITDVFVDGHSNPQLQIIGLKMTPILKNPKHVRTPTRTTALFCSVFLST